jgi:hypothetical protein
MGLRLHSWFLHLDTLHNFKCSSFFYIKMCLKLNYQYLYRKIIQPKCMELFKILTCEI